jgi:hypothetical protein
MIWRGVDGPKDFVAILNRFPPHYQWVTNAIKRLFVAKSIGKSTSIYLLACSSLPPGADSTFTYTGPNDWNQCSNPELQETDLGDGRMRVPCSG